MILQLVVTGSLMRINTKFDIGDEVWTIASQHMLESGTFEQGLDFCLHIKTLRVTKGRDGFYVEYSGYSGYPVLWYNECNLYTKKEALDKCERMNSDTCGNHK